MNNIDKYVASAHKVREGAAAHLKKNVHWLAEQGIRKNGVLNAQDLKRLKPQVAEALRKQID